MPPLPLRLLHLRTSDSVSCRAVTRVVFALPIIPRSNSHSERNRAPADCPANPDEHLIPLVQVSFIYMLLFPFSMLERDVTEIAEFLYI